VRPLLPHRQRKVDILPLSGSKDGLTRREFLTRTRPPKDVKITVNRERCTGCGCCLAECPLGALGLSRTADRDGYQFHFRPDLCDACGRCERSCPENCLRLEQALGEKERRTETEVVFEDEICRCSRCHAPLFPRAMAKRVESMIFGPGKSPWPPWSINLCPSCRLQSPFEGRI